MLASLLPPRLENEAVGAKGEQLKKGWVGEIHPCLEKQTLKSQSVEEDSQTGVH